MKSDCKPACPLMSQEKSTALSWLIICIIFPSSSPPFFIAQDCPFIIHLPCTTPNTVPIAPRHHTAGKSNSKLLKLQDTNSITLENYRLHPSSRSRTFSTFLQDQPYMYAVQFWVLSTLIKWSSSDYFYFHQSSCHPAWLFVFWIDCGLIDWNQPLPLLVSFLWFSFCLPHLNSLTNLALLSFMKYSGPGLAS